MAVFVPFAPTASQAFSFTPTLGGVQYRGVITWNTFAQRWYLNLYSLTGVFLLCVALQPSTQQNPHNLLAPWASTFGSAGLVYDQPNRQLILS